MLMNTAEQILVVILASALAVFLTLAIVIAVQVIRLMKTLNRISERAEQFVDSAEKTAEAVKSAVGQLSVMRFMQNIVEMVHKKSKKSDSKGE
jgi:uncharacterized membrane protein (UPF0182 family)